MLTALRLPLAVLFPFTASPVGQLAIVAVAAASDVLDGVVARRLGGSRAGAVLDPVADKLFMASAFLTVWWRGAIAGYELAGVLLRDIVAVVAFLGTWLLRRPVALPARAGGKVVTILQLLTLAAAIVDSPLVRPLAWATAAIAVYAIWDYGRTAARRPANTRDGEGRGQ